MSDIDEDYELKVEIQKLLGRVNDDMVKLKNEVTALNSLIEDSASLPTTMRLVNEKLILAAKEAGIDLENLGNTVNIDDLEKEQSQENKEIEEQLSDEQGNLKSKTTKMAVAAEKLSKKVKQILK